MLVVVRPRKEMVVRPNNFIVCVCIMMYYLSCIVIISVFVVTISFHTHTFETYTLEYCILC